MRPDVGARTDERAGRLRPVLTRRGDRYGLLLVLLVFSYLLSAFTSSDVTIFQSVLFVGTLLLALRTSRVRRSTGHMIIWGTVIGSLVVAALVLSHATSKDVAVGVANLWTGLILLVTVGVILRRVLEMPTVSLQSIFGAVSAYMIIGLMFASFYGALSHLDSRPFFSHGSVGDTKSFQYFSFTTLTTLGYGDFTAAQNVGRAVAVMEAFGGQIFLATLVARLVASYRAPRRNDAAGLAGKDDGAAGDHGGDDRGENSRFGPVVPGSAAIAGGFGDKAGLPGSDRAARASQRPGNGPRRATHQAPAKWRNRRRR